jgi:hypothetical protein
MNQHPGKDHGRKCEHYVNNEMPARLTLFDADEKSDCEQRSAGGDYNKKKNEEPTQILLLRQLAYFAQRRCQNCEPIKREDRHSERIPTGNCRAGEPKISARNEEYRDTGDQSQKEAVARVWATYEIDNSHLWSRVTKIRQTREATIAKDGRHFGK